MQPGAPHARRLTPYPFSGHPFLCLGSDISVGYHMKELQQCTWFMPLSQERVGSKTGTPHLNGPASCDDGKSSLRGRTPGYVSLEGW